MASARRTRESSPDRRARSGPAAAARPARESRTVQPESRPARRQDLEILRRTRCYSPGVNGRVGLNVVAIAGGLGAAIVAMAVISVRAAQARRGRAEAHSDIASLRARLD